MLCSLRKLWDPAVRSLSACAALEMEMKRRPTAITEMSLFIVCSPRRRTLYPRALPQQRSNALRGTRRWAGIAETWTASHSRALQAHSLSTQATGRTDARQEVAMASHGFTET